MLHFWYIYEATGPNIILLYSFYAIPLYFQYMGVVLFDYKINIHFSKSLHFDNTLMISDFLRKMRQVNLTSKKIIIFQITNIRNMRSKFRRDKLVFWPFLGKEKIVRQFINHTSKASCQRGKFLYIFYNLRSSIWILFEYFFTSADLERNFTFIICYILLNCILVCICHYIHLFTCVDLTCPKYLYIWLTTSK